MKKKVFAVAYLVALSGVILLNSCNRETFTPNTPTDKSVDTTWIDSNCTGGGNTNPYDSTSNGGGNPYDTLNPGGSGGGFNPNDTLNPGGSGGGSNPNDTLWNGGNNPQDSLGGGN